MKTRLRLALFQPDIAANTGAMMRLAACLGTSLDLIEPCGFVLDDKRIRRSAMDYAELLAYRRHMSWEAFLETKGSSRIVLLSTKATQSSHGFRYEGDDILLLGRESGGVPDEVHGVADASVRVPMRDGVRSLNVAMAAAIVVAEALRQTGGLL